MEQETLYNILSGAYGEVLETHAMWECIASLGIKPYKDGNQWCYLYGDNIRDGIVGFGETIFKAAWNFYSQIKTEEIAKCENSGSSEIPNDLEEAAVDIADSLLAKPKDYALSAKADYWNGAHDGVIAGAKWQADHTPLPEDTVLFNKGVEEGKRLMMEEAVEAEISAKFPIVGRSLISVIGMLEGFKYGDKVRIIVIPKED